MKYLIAQHYNWGAFSQVRTVWEYFESIGGKCFDNTKFNSITFNEGDTVFIYSSILGISPDKYQKLKAAGVKIVIFGLSDPTMYKKTRHTNCDAYYTNWYELANSQYYPPVCDPTYHKCLDIKKNIDVIFIGQAPHPVVRDRTKVVQKLRALDVDIKCYGNGWSNGFLQGTEKISIINRAKIYLDITNAKASLGHRVLESSCCGTPIMTLRRPDIETLFEDGKEILFYDSFAELSTKLKYWLERPDELRAIGLAARERCLKDHTVETKFTKIFNFLKI